MANRPIVCVDVDGTLFKLDGTLNQEIVEVIKALSIFCDVWIWSGGGKDYAELRARDAKITEYIQGAISKLQVDLIGRPDITFDDGEMMLGKVNIRVKLFEYE